jgi:hypothetical protein
MFFVIKKKPWVRKPTAFYFVKGLYYLEAFIAACAAANLAIGTRKGEQLT